MKKTVFTIFAAIVLMSSSLLAQSIKEGMGHYYAERFTSAIKVFEKMLAVNPNDVEATYWLGQVYLDMEEIAGARVQKTKELYQKALQNSNNAPLIMVGLGQVDLWENKTADARQKFEAAITASKGRKGNDPQILTAVGRANVKTKAGDYKYAVTVLEEAVDKGGKEPEILLELGNAYRKVRPGEGGGDAYKMYKKALDENKSFAVASLRLAKLFESQKNWDLVLDYLNDAIKRDPGFSVAYYELYYYYFYMQDYDQAEVQLKKYIDSKLPERDIQDEYLYAQLCWARKDFACATQKAESIVSTLGADTKPKVYRLLADAYFQKGDYTQAKKYSDAFFAKKNPDDIISYDYKLKADILAKTGGTPDEIYYTFLEGAAIDTINADKIKFLERGAETFRQMGDRKREGDLRLAAIKLKKEPSQRDIFDAGFAYYQGNALEKSDSMFAYFTDKWPEESYGWQMRFAIGRMIDTSMKLGTAVPFGIKYLEVLEKDTAKNKDNILSTAAYLAQYYANIAKDNPKAIEYFKKMQVYSPENEDIKRYIEILEKAPGNKPATNPKNDGTTPKSGTAKPGASSGIKADKMNHQYGHAV